MSIHRHTSLPSLRSTNYKSAPQHILLKKMKPILLLIASHVVLMAAGAPLPEKSNEKNAEVKDDRSPEYTIRINVGPGSDLDHVVVVDEKDGDGEIIINGDIVHSVSKIKNRDNGEIIIINGDVVQQVPKISLTNDDGSTTINRGQVSTTINGDISKFAIVIDGVMHEVVPKKKVAPSSKATGQ